MSVIGLPGVKTARTATPRDIVMSDEGLILCRNSIIIDASKSRDYGNTSDGTNYDVIRAGMPLIKESGGLYVPWVMGVLTAAYDKDATAAVQVVFNIGAGGATALQKFFGGVSGTCYITGDDAVGTAATDVYNAGSGYESVTVTGINTTTGDITISGAASADYYAGSIVTSYGTAPECILMDKTGVKVTDRDGNDVDVPARKCLVGGYLRTTMIVGWPPVAYISLAKWLQSEVIVGGVVIGLRNKMPALYFSDEY